MHTIKAKSCNSVIKNDNEYTTYYAALVASKIYPQMCELRALRKWQTSSLWYNTANKLLETNLIFVVTRTTKKLIDSTVILLIFRLIDGDSIH